MTIEKMGKWGVLGVMVLFAVAAGLLFCGCSKDIMYGPGGEVVQMKSPKKKLKIEYEKDQIEIEGARGIGGRSRVRIPPVPVETEEETVGIHGVMVPPQAPVVPVAPIRERSLEVEQTDVVR